MCAKPLFTVTPVDELQLRRLEKGYLINQSLKKTGSIAGIRTPPIPNPKLVVQRGKDALFVSPAPPEKPTQLVLAVIAQAISNMGWEIGNAYLALSLKGPWHYFKSIGFKSLRPGQHWTMIRYRSPIEMHLLNQKNRLGFEALLVALNNEPREPMSMQDFSKLSMRCFTAAMSDKEKFDYYYSRR